MGNTTNRVLHKVLSIEGLPDGYPNYIVNGIAESGALGWSTYADAAGAAPVDGTGGSPNVTFVSDSTNVLKGNSSFLFTKDAANRQGQGVSYDFSSDATTLGKVLKIEFDYRVLNAGTFAAGTLGPSGTNSDVTVWMYDRGNSVVIQPSTFRLYSNSASLSDRFSGYFQVAANSTDLRLIFHVSTVSTTGYSLIIDNVTVSPSQYIYGTPVTDWQSYTPVTSGVTFSSPEFRWRRVGSSTEIEGKGTVSASAASEIQIGLPSGQTSADTTTIPSLRICGISSQTDAAFSAIEPSKTYFVMVTAATTPVKLNSNTVWANTDVVHIKASIPITGWSSSVQMSDSADTRVVAARYHISSAASTTNANPINYEVKDFDTHSAVSIGASTWNFKVPVSGYYRVSGANYASATQAGYFVYINGILNSHLGNSMTANNVPATGSTTFQLNVGDTIDVRPNGTLTPTSATSGTIASINYITIERLTGPSAIAATETIAARAYNSSTSISGSLATIVWTTEDYDTHGALASGVFTCPAPGKYQWNMALALSGTFILNNTTVIEVQKNGTAVSAATHYIAAAVTNEHIQLSDFVNCNTGDTIRVQISNSGTTPALVNSNTRNFFSIQRVGL